MKKLRGTDAQKGDFHDGRARVELGGKYGYIDAEGREITPLKYTYAWDFHDGRAMVELNGKRGFIDTEGKETWKI